MAEVTLEMVLSEMKRIEIAQREQIQSLDVKLTGRLDKLQESVECIAGHVSKLADRVNDHEYRVKKLEGPSA